ncbi:MAG: hypothetical protein SCK70_00295 [bacterium]|nr:hypothetical protein [bacterium]
MTNKLNIFITQIIAVILVLCSNLFCNSMFLADTTIICSTHITNSDSIYQNVKISYAPIIAFGIVGAFSGAAIGGTISPPQRYPDYEFGLNVSKAGAIGFGIGALVGGYIGYQLAKRDYERDIKAQKSNIIKNNKKKNKQK